MTLQGVLGTPAVLIGVGTTALAQRAFTYLPWLQTLFDTRPLDLAEGLAVIGIGVALLILCELEKRIRRALLG